MQTFTTYRAAAEKLAPALVQKGDDDWKMIVDGETFDVSDGYDLRRSDNQYSLYCKVRMLAGTDWQDLHPGVTLDRIQITRWHPDTCECATTFTWDRASSEDDRIVHPHKGEKHCEVHAHMKDDHHGHCHELWAENRHKNHAVNKAAETMVPKFVNDNRAALERKLADARVESGDTEITIEQLAMRAILTQIKHSHREHKGERKLHIEHPSFKDRHLVTEVRMALRNCPLAGARDFVVPSD